MIRAKYSQSVVEPAAGKIAVSNPFCSVPEGETVGIYSYKAIVSYNMGSEWFNFQP